MLPNSIMQCQEGWTQIHFQILDRVRSRERSGEACQSIVSDQLEKFRVCITLFKMRPALALEPRAQCDPCLATLTGSLEAAAVGLNPVPDTGWLG